MHVVNKLLPRPASCRTSVVFKMNEHVLFFVMDVDGCALSGWSERKQMETMMHV